MDRAAGWDSPQRRRRHAVRGKTKVERTSACLHGGDKLGVASRAATEHKAALPKLKPTTSAPGVTDCGRPDGPSSALSGRRICDRPDCVRCRDSVRSRHDIFEHEIATRRLHASAERRSNALNDDFVRLACSHCVARRWETHNARRLQSAYTCNKTRASARASERRVCACVLVTVGCVSLVLP